MLHSTRAADHPFVTPSCVRGLHVLTLSSFGITQPLLDALGKRTIFLSEQQIAWPHVLILLGVLNIVLPVVLIACDWLVQTVSQWIGHGRNTVLVFLMLVVLLSVVRPTLSKGWLAEQALAGFTALIVLTPSAVGLVSLYERYGWLRCWLTVASAGAIVFPAHFLWQFAALQRHQATVLAGSDIGNPVPVVVVIYDEFCATTLLRGDGEIDAQRFPNLARLQSSSTFYRNATTVHPRTVLAVPAMLTGCFPDDGAIPPASLNPANLFQLIESTKRYEQVVFEPVTRLCPDPAATDAQADAGFTKSCFSLIHSLWAVYPRLLLPGDTPITFPAIPRPWFEVPPPAHPQESLDRTEGVFRYSTSPRRADQFQHLLKCVKRSDKPRFCFFHTVLPHYPWCYLPDGQQYLDEDSARYHPSGTTGELGEQWRNDSAIVARNEQRYRLQIGFVDLQIGQLLDHLEAAGLLNECLLVVAGDHGVSFRPGHSRRVPDAETLPDIMSVPLFIKLPGQTVGRIDDRNVQSIDLLPSIAEALQLPLPNPVDGVSVTKEERSPRKSFFFENQMTVIEADFPQRLGTLARQVAMFGTGPLDQPIAACTSHLEWHGRFVNEFTVDPKPMPCSLSQPLEGLCDREIATVPFSRRFIAGWFKAIYLPESAGEIVVAVDGIVIDSGTSFPVSRSIHAFEFLLPANVVISNSSKIELYLVSSESGRPRLQRLENSDQIPIPYPQL